MGYNKYVRLGAEGIREKIRNTEKELGWMRAQVASHEADLIDLRDALTLVTEGATNAPNLDPPNYLFLPAS